MAKPISLQLYTLRDALAQDFESVIRKVAAIGYVGVEPFGGLDAQKVADLCKELGLQIASTHMSLPEGDKRDEILAAAKTLGVKYLVCPWISPDEWKTVEGAKAACKRLNDANKTVSGAGMTLGYHNHWAEYEPIAGGTYPYKVMAQELDSSIILEIDTYWAKVGGCDPAAVITELGERAKLLHIKDGPADSREAPMVAVGSGKMDVPGIINAGQFAEWEVVELDRCATDMMTAVEESYQYLVGKGLASGRK